MKSGFIALAVLLCGTTAMAQQGGLFPELDSQFENPIQKVAPTVLADTTATADTNEDTAHADQDDKKIRIELQNLKGALPYARSMAYCSGEAVLTNETRQVLQTLNMTLTYQDMDAPLSFGSVKPGGKQAQRIMLIGPPCEAILNMPEIAIQSCQLGTQSGKACEKKVQFLPPHG